ncbi:hypothetical protein [Brevundimonas sp.]|jgi:hypothetical protein|uniref:hypothetical protein n=1 Tax=Brevundimonas sp. TaxID=1871086 RepID=UPI0037BF887C
MSLLLAAALALALNGRQTPPASWTWTLYEGDGPVVLANEVPDTANLRATLQCDPRSSVIDITVYEEAPPASQTPAEAAPPAGFARLTSGSASATSEMRASRAGRLAVTLRTDHPVFTSFVGGGDLTLMAGDRTRTIKVERPHLAKLRRFADRCAG